MNWTPPEKVLITSGREVGGLASFAEALGSGFTELGIPLELIKPATLLSRLRELRSQRILKILSTTGLLFTMLARRAICVSHGMPMVREQGWLTPICLMTCYKLANLCPSARLLAVSDYTAMNLKYLLNVQIDAVVRDPLANLFLEPFAQDEYERSYITYVGRMREYKKLDLLLRPICDLLDENPGFRCCVVGDGPYRRAAEQSVAGNDRIEFVGSRDSLFVREQLRRSKIFVSGAGNEGFGIVYLEALSQGCVVAMPAGGGGIEIALQSIGSGIQLLPISLERQEVLSVLRRAMTVQPSPISLAAYSPRAIASEYLRIDRLFFARQISVPETVSDLR